jgi:hypothetical protein
MPETSPLELVKNLDRRIETIEQILPTLATKQDLQEAIGPLATREEMHAAIAAAVAPLATREEMRAAIAAAVAPLATREEMHAAIASAIAPLATREEMRAAIAAEGQAARRHTTVLFEDLRDDNRIILEHLVALSARVDQLASR